MLVCLKRESDVETQGQLYEIAFAKVTHRQTKRIFPLLILGMRGNGWQVQGGSMAFHFLVV